MAEFKVLLKSINTGKSKGIPSYELYRIFNYNIFTSSSVEDIINDFNNYTGRNFCNINNWTASQQDLLMLYNDNVNDPRNIELFKKYLTLDVKDSLNLSDNSRDQKVTDWLEHKKQNLLNGTSLELSEEYLKKHFPFLLETRESKELDYKKIIKDYFGEDKVSIHRNLIYIYFPKLNVSNSNGRSHTIYEVYAKINIHSTVVSQVTDLIPHFLLNDMSSDIINNYTESYDIKLQLIEACRTLVSQEEFDSQYIFSHVGRGQSGWRGCCLGEGILRKYYNNSIKTEDEVLGFCAALENYFTWESLEGGPYIQMSSIRPSTARTQNRFPNTEVVKDSIYKNLIHNKPEGFIVDINGFNFNIRINENILKKLSPFFLLNNGGLSTPVTLNDFSIEKEDTKTAKTKLSTRGENNFVFKGEQKGIVYVDPSLNKNKTERVLSGNLEQYFPQELVITLIDEIKNIIKNDKPKYLEKKPTFIFSEV